MRSQASPIILFCQLLLVILASEVVVMYLLPYLIPVGSSAFIENFSDGFLLTFIVAPILWQLIIRPLKVRTDLAEKKSDFIVNNSVGGIISTDSDGVILTANSGLEKILNLSRDQILGQNLEIFFKDISLRELAPGAYFEQEAVVKNTLEPVVHIRSSGALFENKWIYILFITDITAKKRLELDLQMQQEKNIHNSKLAALGEMAGGVAHEINNPVGIIQGKSMQLMSLIKRNRATPEHMVTELSKIIETSERISKIIKGLRSFSREGDKDPFAPIELKSLLENVMGLCQEKFKSHLVKVSCNVSSGIVIHCRGVQIEQVFLNLLNNAHDAVAALPDKWIRIDTEVLDGVVKISFTDSGNGIPADVVSKMMQPFYTTKGVGKGTGLGLSISKGIIEDHQGTLQYDASSVNTCFAVNLPIGKNEGIKTAA